MRMSQVYNLSLLSFIEKEGKITIDDSKRKYLPPEQPGIIQGERVMFEKNLKVLEEEGYIKIEDDIIEYIGR